MRRRILFRCDGGALQEIGTGHIVRCLSLARELVLSKENELCFVMLPNEWEQRVRDAGLRVHTLDPQESEHEQLLDAARQMGADIVVLDNLGRSREVIESLQAEGRVVVSIDDPHSPQLSDVSLNPAFAGVGATYDGSDCTILLETLQRDASTAIKRGVFASFGGFDPEDLAIRFLKAWCSRERDLDCTLAIGVEHARMRELFALAEASPRTRVLAGAELGPHLRSAQVAITNGGTTMFWAAACGVPTIAVAQYEHQIVNADRLEQLGAARSAGLARDIDFDDLCTDAQTLALDSTQLTRMSRAGRRALPGLGRRLALQVITTVERLDWDSDFFGRNIATLHPNRLSLRILKLAFEQCERAQIDCLYFLASGASTDYHALAEANGFRCVDDRLTYVIDVEAPVHSTNAGAWNIRPGRAQDADALTEIAGQSYGASRYFHDPGFPKDRCEQFYRDWIRKSLAGKFDDIVLVAEVDGAIAGYISCRAVTVNLGIIGLVGIAPTQRGRGLGKALIAAAMHWFVDNDLVTVEVVTQGRNLPAQALYESTGFQLKMREKWFHKWFESAPQRAKEAR